VIAYPYHPLVGRPVLVTGDHEHDGVHYFLIRQPQGGSFQVPGWMFDPAACSMEIVTVPRLPVSQLLQLRSLASALHRDAFGCGTRDNPASTTAGTNCNPTASEHSASESRN
jgi:hypothetical protein